MMIIKESVELTEDSDRASGQASMTPKRKHVEGRGTMFWMTRALLFFFYKTGRLLGNGAILMIMLMRIIQNFFVSTQMLISQ
jgi:hypothetical protein